MNTPALRNRRVGLGLLVALAVIGAILMDSVSIIFIISALFMGVEQVQTVILAE